MKNIIVILMVCISASFSMFGQADCVKGIKPVEATAEDYISLLNLNGYKAYSFDISSLLDGQYYIVLSIKEYKDGNLVADSIDGNDRCFSLGNNMYLISDLPKKIQDELQSDDIADPDRGIFKVAKKIMIGFYPGNNETVKNMMVNLENMSAHSQFLNLYPQYRNNDSINGEKLYMYLSKPFKTAEFVTDQFIPLVLLGSAWYDERFNFHRFCGEKEIDPDMSSELLQYVPHYYIIGVELKPIKILQ